MAFPGSLSPVLAVITTERAHPGSGSQDWKDAPNDPWKAIRSATLEPMTPFLTKVLGQNIVSSVEPQEKGWPVSRTALELY